MSQVHFFAFLKDEGAHFVGRPIKSGQRLDELFGRLTEQFKKSMDRKIVTQEDSDLVRTKKIQQIAEFLRLFLVRRSVSMFQAEAYRFIALAEIARGTFIGRIWAELVKGVFGVQVAHIRNFLAHADFDYGTSVVISSVNLEGGWVADDIVHAYSNSFEFLLPGVETHPRGPRFAIGDFISGFQACCCLFTALFNQYCVTNRTNVRQLFGLYDVKAIDRVMIVTVDGKELPCDI
jgi:hypothetical protein